MAEPVAVRYGFCNFFRVNLYNKSGLPAVPFRTDTWEQGSYARWFADSEMMRFPQAYRLDHGKRLFFGYAQGVGCCAMLQMWKATGERRYYDYVKQWADSLINEKEKSICMISPLITWISLTPERCCLTFTVKPATNDIKRQWISLSNS